MSKNYSIGLDIGVSSVGWACLTNDFRIPKYNGKYAIGVREFESADTAEERRIQRGTRRRYNRRIRRIQLLQQVLSPLFMDDPTFFISTEEKEKHFWRNSNQFEQRSLSETLKSLGINPKKYPTIYHLRHDIIEHPEIKFHPRLLYLALHNLVKFRGHFLNENMSWLDNSSQEPLHEKIYTFLTELNNHFEHVEELTIKQAESVVQIMMKDNITNADKRTAILRILGQQLRQPVTLILGLKANISQLFPSSENLQLYKEEKLSLSFKDDNLEETMEKLTDEERMIVDLANVIYQDVLLKDLLGNARYVSEAKVHSYDQFGNDLRELKDIFNQFFDEKAYRQMFITSRKNMTEYINTRKQNLLSTFDQFLRIYRTEEKFYRDLTNQLKSLMKENLTESEQHRIQHVIHRLERNQFLQKQKSTHNAAIPHQNNVYEAKVILKNQQKFYPEITDQMIQRITDIIRFRIPYYIGPLIKDQTNPPFGWAIRNSDEPVLPWTIDQVIDRSASAEQFINRMTSFCSYLTDEKVLPKHSLTYEMFEVLNELNGIQIRSNNDQPHRKYRLGLEEKQWIIENVFKKYKSVTHRRLQNELMKSPYKEIILDVNSEGVYEIYGTQKEDRFSTSLSSHIDMIRIFGDINESNEKMIEEIIYWISVFEEKDILKMKIKEKYPHITNQQIKSLQNLNYTGWGRLSNKLLNELIVDNSSNSTILDLMKNEPYVFMEVLAIEKYNLEERITKMNMDHNQSFTRITYQDIEQLQGSPAIKKGIWQAVLIIEELVDIFGEPEHIMIEFAREDEEVKERTSSRKKQINDLYRAISRDEKDLKDFLKSHTQYDDTKYQNDRLYLYIIQGGKCMYSGEKLDPTRLSEYEIDHIYPRSFVKDDSIDNLALVTQQMNQAKAGSKMPLEVINDKYKQKMYWKKLFDLRLISQTKYFRLMKEAFTDQDKESFFARQLVETRQITRHVKDLLQERFEHTEIHPVNANIVTNLRNHCGAIKIRELNNKHHAVDAAFANLIIQYIINEYGHNFLNFNFKYQEARKKWREMITKYRKNFFLFSDIVNDQNFTHYKTGEIITGHQFLCMLNDEIPWQTTKKIGTNESAFYKETLFSPKVEKPRYESAKTAKGVYKEMKTDSTYLISYIEKGKNGKQVKKSDFVDLYVIEKYQMKGKKEKELAMFLAKKLAKGEVIDAIIHTRVLKYQFVKVNNHLLSVVSSREKHNAKQLILDRHLLEKLYQIISSHRAREEVEVNILKETFTEIMETVKDQYKEFINESSMNRIISYVDGIKDNTTFLDGLYELLKTTSASAARSTKFGVRYTKKNKPSEVKFIHQSITGLRYRKPKSYENLLWSK